MQITREKAVLAHSKQLRPWQPQHPFTPYSASWAHVHRSQGHESLVLSFGSSRIYWFLHLFFLPLLCVYVCTDVYICTCAQRPENNLRLLPSLLRQSLSWAWRSPIKPGFWSLGTGMVLFPYPFLKHLDYKHTYTTLSIIFTLVLGTAFKSLYLQGTHVRYWLSHGYTLVSAVLLKTAGKEWMKRPGMWLNC